ncbi:MAG: Mrp/NBP35 family ATP-binding protein [Pirellulales bacterium]|nr:Mrp/NBP35 family ATP-binding protein [Pirellulales bacterium]
MAADLPQLADIEAELARFRDPESGRGVVENGQVRDVRLQGDHLALVLELSTHVAPLWQQTRDELAAALRSKFPGLAAVDIQLDVLRRPVLPIGQIGLCAKSVIAVGSGKGGVGKSTIATSLAFGLRRAGCVVGLMDADVYGPSVPHLIGVQQRPSVTPEKKLAPIEAGGLKVMSMGFLVAPGDAVVWRGPMLHGAITNFLKDTDWGELDYLIIDMPPGTGDIALTLSQLLPLTGAVVVCTPQDVALADAVKAIAMFRKVNIPLLGMVENMSYFLCPGCNQRYEIFGSGGAQRKAAELEVPFLGEVPINMHIRAEGDAGRVAATFDDPQVAPYLEAICRNLVRGLADRHRAAPVLPSLTVL